MKNCSTPAPASRCLLAKRVILKLGTAADPDQDHKVAYAYDTAGRLSTVTAPGSRTYTYGYETNAPGLRKTVTGPVHTATWTFAPTRT